MECCCKKTNLKVETLNVLADYNLSESDILWIGGRDFCIEPEKFWELAADTNYNSGFSRQMIASDLTIVCNGGYLVRESYAGCEWWKFKAIPKKPTSMYDVTRLMCSIDDDALGGQTLKEMNLNEEPA